MVPKNFRTDRVNKIQFYSQPRHIHVIINKLGIHIAQIASRRDMTLVSTKPHPLEATSPTQLPEKLIYTNGPSGDECLRIQHSSKDQLWLLHESRVA